MSSMNKSAGKPVSETSHSATISPGTVVGLHPAGLGVFTPSSALSLLAEAASQQLTPEQRQWLRDGTLDEAQTCARHAGAVAESIACLVASEASHPGYQRSGSFQSPHDVPILLLHLQNAFSQIEGMLALADGLAQGGAA